MATDSANMGPFSPALLLFLCFLLSVENRGLYLCKQDSQTYTEGKHKTTGSHSETCHLVLAGC